MVVGYLRPDVIVLVDSFITNQEKYLNIPGFQTGMTDKGRTGNAI